MVMMCGIARLSEDTLKAVKNLEIEMGKHLLAYSCGNVEPAELTDDELARLQKAEAEMGVSLVAYKD